MNASPRKAREVFLAAVKLPADQRQAYLQEACGGDVELQRRVGDLLQAQAEIGSFCEGPTEQPAVAVDQPMREAPGTVIGPYKLLQPIGEGGMGAVWMAEQTEPVKRKVALKVIKPGMDSRQVIARFEAERQALALMDHVSIARVFDGGTTEAGRPYFVMELVHGVPITRYCDDNHLTPRERLELFVPVCQAIQHAHQKGIIHRDVKPSNVMVTLYDGKPVPKVIDFGVAKATEQKLTEQTLFTQYGTIVGTLEYMSPEQAEMSALGVDTRSDIYSLGVLLYELLTGSTPLTHKRMKEAAYAEILRMIKEEEPPRPSTRVSDSGETLASISANRHTDPTRLAKLMRGELDWIVMRALEKDRNRRYETANSFAADVQRYLNDDPVQACPPSVWYRLRKFVRRKKWALAAAAVLGAAVLVAIGAVAWSVGWANRDREVRQAAVDQEVDLTLKEAERLERQGKWPESLSVAKQAEGLLAGGASEAIRERVREFRRHIEMVLRLEDARVQGLCHSEKDFFDQDEMDRAYRKAFADYEIDVEALPADRAAELIRASPIRLELTAALDAWVWVLVLEPWGGVRPQPSPLKDKLLAIARAADADPFRNRVRDALRSPKSGQQFVDHLLELTRSPQARELPPSTLCALEQAVHDWRRQPVTAPLLRDAQQRHPDDFWVNFWLATSLERNSDNGDEAIRFYSAAVALRPSSASALLRLGMNLKQQGRLEEAIACFRRAIEVQPQYVHPYLFLGITLDLQGKRDEAIACLQEAIERNPKSWSCYLNLGIVLEKIGRLEEAIDAFKKVIELHPRIDFQGHKFLVDALAKAGRLDEALAMDQKAVELDPNNPSKLICLGLTLRTAGRLDEAIDCYHRALAGGWTDSRALLGLVIAHCDKGEIDEATASLRKLIKVVPLIADRDNYPHRALRDAAGLKMDGTEMISYGLGGTLAQLGRWNDAAYAFDYQLKWNPEKHEWWHRAATLHAAVGDAEGYRRTCRGMLERFGDTYQPQTAELTAKDCLLLPDTLSAADFDRVQKLAVRAVTGTENARLYRYFVMAKGLADYRAGRHEDALKWLERFRPNANGTHWDATTFAVVALAQHGLGHLQQAQASVAKARAILAKKMPDPAKGQLFYATDWQAWLHAQILCHEAEGLLEKESRKKSN